MFMHIFTYRLRVLLRDKEMIFWTMLFPIALSIFFYMSLSGLRNMGTFEPIPVAVVENQVNDTFSDVLDAVSSGESPLLSMDRVDGPKALSLLEASQVSGIITLAPQPTLTVNASGLHQSILKSFMDQYAQTTVTIQRILTENPGAGPQIGEILAQQTDFTVEVPLGNGDYNMVLSYYYALIAMTCFYGGFFGMEEINQIQANLSKRGARINLAPVHKMKAFLYSLSASILIHLIEVALFLAFLVFVLDVRFGSQTGRILLITALGALTGVSFGAFVSAIFKLHENAKSGLFVGITMLGSFLAGLMFGDMKYLVQTHAPILARLNPIHLLADAYYALYVFDSPLRYYQNMAGLVGFTLFFSIGTYLIIRRRTYASL
jgi:ABC-2 type transport system permease protein